MKENHNDDDHHNHNHHIEQHQRQLEQNASERFLQGITDVLMAIEELRRQLPPTSTNNNGSSSGGDATDETTTSKRRINISVDTVTQWQYALDQIVHILHPNMTRWLEDAMAAATVGTDNAFQIMYQHALHKATTIAQEILTMCCSQYIEPSEPTASEEDHTTTAVQHQQLLPVDEQRRNGQMAMARITEINLILLSCCHSNTASTTNQQQQQSHHQHPPAEARLQSTAEISQLYVQYQRQVLRLRVKPTIAQLVQLRRSDTTNIFTPAMQGGIHYLRKAPSNKKNAPIVPGGAVILNSDDDDENDDDNTNQNVPTDNDMQQYHAPVMTHILGEAAALIHPLALWMYHIKQSQQQLVGRSDANNNDNDEIDDVDTMLYQMCRDTIQVLNEQAQILTKTISDWFWMDRPVDIWIAESNRDLSTITTADGSTTHDSTVNDIALSRLDALVEEMAFVAQIYQRYQTLLLSTTSTSPSSGTEQPQSSSNNTNVIGTELVPEWTLKYSALERYLTVQQWSTAIQQAIPVTIVVGTEIRVPSVVEDAQYLSTRALERAATTQSLSAIATVAYAICYDIWSTTTATTTTRDDATAATTVYQALLNEMGCWSDTTTIEDGKSESKNVVTLSPPRSGDFAAALLDALDNDDDDTQQHGQKSSPNKSSNKAPSSGNFLLASLGVVGDSEKSEQRQLDTLYCLLNGIHAVSGASRGLVVFLDDLLHEHTDSAETGAAAASTTDVQKSTSMIQLVREELDRYAQTYETLLIDRVTESVALWCGGDISSSHRAHTSRTKKGTLCFHQLVNFFDHETYSLDGSSITNAESNDRLEKELLGPLRSAKFLKQLPDKCEGQVLKITAERVATVVVDLILSALWYDSAGNFKTKTFTDWGAILLSKQSRLLLAYISTEMQQPTTTNLGGGRSSNVVSTTATASVLQVWERLSQVITVLQLEKPSDWLAYHATSILSDQEVLQSLSLRVDFSSDAIESVVATLAPRTPK